MRLPRDIQAKLPLLALAAALACAAPAVAQGTVAGQVVDASGRPVAGAAVQLGAGTRVLADAQGRFTISRVAPSAYDAVVSRLGYHPQAERWTVVAGDTLRVTVRMTAEEAALAQLRALAIAEFEAQQERHVGGTRTRAVFRAQDLERSTAPSVAELVRSRGGFVRVPCNTPATVRSRTPRNVTARDPALTPQSPRTPSPSSLPASTSSTAPPRAGDCVRSAGRIVQLTVSVDGRPGGELRGLEALPLHEVARVEVAQGSGVAVYTRGYFDRMARNGMVAPES